MSDPDAPLTDAERYPGLSDHGRRMLDFLREHPRAPIYRNQSGHRLTAADVARVREHERAVLSADVAFTPGVPPPWVASFVERCLADVPFYRGYGGVPGDFAALPTIGRADLSHDVAAFVPDSVPVDRLINFRTSGTTGHPLLLASHPVVAASYLAFHKRALSRIGIALRHGRGQVGVVLVGFQRACFTYVSVTPTMDESGLAKINLHPADWRHPDDRAVYLDALAAEVYTGDPIAFAELMTLPLRTRPRVMLSTSMALTAVLAARLEAHFGCAVLDLYSLNEAGPVAVADAIAGGHVLLQPELYVEILDPAGRPLPPGTRGEITLTGGFNFCLPLLRYRTGDRAALAVVRGELVLVGLEGRPPVRYRTMAGEWINNIEVTHALRRFALAQYALHQDATGALRLRLVATGDPGGQIRKVLLELFGSGQALVVDDVAAIDDKVVQYTSDLAGAPP
jgi:phenylacetate-CoA ligase